MRCFHWDYLDAHLPHGEHHVEVVEKISLGCGETNGIAIHPAHNTIIVAGGDTKAYLYDYEYSKVVGALKGHEEYLHDVILDKKSGSLVATVRMVQGSLVCANQSFLVFRGLYVETMGFAKPSVYSYL